VNPSYTRGTGTRAEVQDGLGKNVTEAKKGWEYGLSREPLPSQCESLCSNPEYCIEGKKEKKKVA
jgi:hypothetical protein